MMDYNLPLNLRRTTFSLFSLVEICFFARFLHNFSLLCSIFFLGCTIFILLRSMKLGCTSQKNANKFAFSLGLH